MKSPQLLRRIAHKFEAYRWWGSPQALSALPIAEVLNDLYRIDDPAIRNEAVKLFEQALACSKVMQMDPTNFAPVVTAAFKRLVDFLHAKGGDGPTDDTLGSGPRERIA